MKEYKPNSDKSEDLRRMAEEQLRKKKAKKIQKMDDAEVRALAHELQVHQIELEMQNEELQRARAEAEDALGKYTDLYDFAPVGYFTFDGHGTILEVNLSGAKLLGIERDILIKSQFRYFVEPNSIAEFNSFCKRISETDCKQTCALLLRNNKSTMYVIIEGVAVHDAEGNAKQIRAAIIDVTDRKQAEEQLRLANGELRQRTVALILSDETLCSLRNILNNMGDGLVVADIHGKFIYINPTAEKILGKGLRKITAYEWSEQYRFYRSDMATPYQAEDLPLSRAIRGESVDGAEVFVQHVKEPIIMWISVTARPLLDERGVSKGGVAVFRDVTRQKQAEELKLETDERFKAFMDNNPAVAFMKDEKGYFVYINATYMRFFKTTMENYIRKTDFDLWPVEVAKQLRENDKAVLSANKAIQTYEKVPTPDGILRDWLVLKFPVKDRSGSCYLGGVAIDITDRKQAERRLSAQHTVTQILAEATSIAEASPKILQTICECLEWDIGELWAVDSESNVLRLVESWHLPSVKAPEFEAMSRKITFSPGVGLPGRVWVDGKPFWITDVTKDANFPRIAVAAKEGLRGAFCFPVMVQDEILGVVDFFSCKTRQPDDDLLNMILAIGRQIGLFVKRRQADKISKRLSRQNELILNSAGEGIYGLDRNGCATFINHSASKMLGWGVDELIGKFMHAITHHSKPDGTPYPPEECPVFTVLQKGEIQRVDNEVFWRKDGTSFPVRYASTPIVEQDKVVGAVVTFDDITEHKRTELEYKTVLRTAMDGFWVADTEGRLLDVNDASCRLTGYSREELLTMRIRDIEDKETHEDVAQHMKKIMETGYDRFETRHRCKDGKVVDIEVSVNYVKIAGGRFFAFLRDITERKKSDAQIRLQLQRLAVISNIDKAILSTLDLSVTLDIFLDKAFPQLHVDAADILLFNPYMQTLEYAVGSGFHTSAIQRTRVRLGEGCCGRAAVERRPVFIHNLREESCVRSKQLSMEESFVSYYAVPLIAKGQVNGVLEVFHRAPFDPDQEWLGFLEMLTGQAAIAIDNARLFEGLQHANTELFQAYDKTIEGWSKALDLRDKETEGHSQRVTDMTVQISIAMGINKEHLIHVRRGALLHDIGKMGVPDNILLKADKLTDEEWVLMRKHPVYAYEMLFPIAYLRPALDIPYCHHEKWDGTGYPRGLKGEDIPLAARIFAVVDVWDAMRSDRPYRKGWAEEKVREYIKSLAGTHFDPQVVEVFLKEKW